MRFRRHAPIATLLALVALLAGAVSAQAEDWAAVEAAAKRRGS
jgi:hypothetical protein